MKQVTLSEEDFIWLQNMMLRAKEKLRTNASAYDLALGEQILRVNKAFEAADTIKVAATAPEEPSPPKPKAARRKKSEPAIVPRNACVDHPKYGGKRMPRTECSGCWNFYRFLNPAAYPGARRKFELQQRKKHKV